MRSPSKSLLGVVTKLDKVIQPSTIDAYSEENIVLDFFIIHFSNILTRSMYPLHGIVFLIHSTIVSIT